MKIEVIGPGCPFCRRLHQRVAEVVKENGLDAEVTHTTDFSAFIRWFPRTPVLIVDGEVVHKGKILPKKVKILGWLLKEKNIHK